MEQRRLKLLDLYCGLGGMSVGFEMTGAYRVLAGLDNYEWAVKAFYNNHHSTTCSPNLKQPVDLATYPPSQLLDDLGERPDVIVGGPPCQGFSHAGRRLDDLMEDPRNHNVFHYYEFIKELRPKAFLMENVTGITRTGQEKENSLLDMLKVSYGEIGYTISWKILNSSHYRVPQVRKRMIYVGILDTERPFEFPTQPCDNELGLFGQKEKILTVADALSDLPSPIDSEPQPYINAPKTSLQTFLRQGSDSIYNHTQTKHSPEMLEKLRKQKVGTGLYDWNHSWIKLDPSRPSPTVKQNNRAPAVHYAEPRSTSPRECARLQTLPDSYVLPGTKTAQLVMLGNAVPSIFAAHLGTALAEQAFDISVPKPWNAYTSPLSLNSVAP